MARPVTVSDGVSRAVRKITGTSLPAARSLRHTSKPSMSGSITSSTIRSGRAASACRSASLPLFARWYRAAVELQRDLYQLADVRLVVHDEHLGDPVIVCHHLGTGRLAASGLPGARAWRAKITGSRRLGLREPAVPSAGRRDGQCRMLSCRRRGLLDAAGGRAGRGGWPDGGLTTISRASLAPDSTGPPTQTGSPVDSALWLVFCPLSRTTVLLTRSQVQVVPSAARTTTSLPLTRTGPRHARTPGCGWRRPGRGT